ncbi:alpha/beta hydrolase [Desulfovibrio sulfodismutans]|uniref:Alpha/beta hydrolase n=1 Tax=Desulfolutivibrio sulfodismutans TaxID=63561 RepID=A0A7K3NP09_9BACT|nr:alpha/beta fold hydrolase [Desulfolutivibrio sulfodismutans]NDY57932.1 alpha/beta hydrolase [Desulfolutivibrio sulfodismutans]QLA10973.1 alpha/beta fold hydrolase [Desulfolutivibrio sulfodismutans DSM 3696]
MGRAERPLFARLTRYAATFFALALVAGLVCRGAGWAETAEPQRTVAAADGTLLDVRVLGQGPPLLLLTGYAMTSGMWDQEFVRGLAAGHTVILMDNRGMGPSALPPGAEISIGRMADDAATVLEALGLGRADVLGWSMGGMIALELALARPEAVCSLALMSSVADMGLLLPALNRMGTMGGEEIRGAMFPADWLAAHPGVWARVVPRPRPPDMAVIQGQEAAMRRWPGAMGRLLELRGPVLLLAGGADWVCPPEAQQAMYDRLDGRTAAPTVLAMVGQGSHWMMHQFPDMLAGMVNGFLAAGRAGPPGEEARPSPQAACKGHDAR